MDDIFDRTNSSTTLLWEIFQMFDKWKLNFKQVIKLYENKCMRIELCKCQTQVNIVQSLRVYCRIHAFFLPILSICRRRKTGSILHRVRKLKVFALHKFFFIVIHSFMYLNLTTCLNTTVLSSQGDNTMLFVHINRSDIQISSDQRIYFFFFSFIIWFNLWKN